MLGLKSRDLEHKLEILCLRQTEAIGRGGTRPKLGQDWYSGPGVVGVGLMTSAMVCGVRGGPGVRQKLWEGFSSCATCIDFPQPLG